MKPIPIGNLVIGDVYRLESERGRRWRLLGLRHGPGRKVFALLIEIDGRGHTTERMIRGRSYDHRGVTVRCDRLILAALRRKRRAVTASMTIVSE